METNMLRWTAGVTRMDRIRNDAIWQKFGVAPIADKMREARLRWYGHVLCGKEDSIRKIDLNFEYPVPWTLLYADDVMLASEDKDELERELQAWCDRLERFGLKLNVKKIEYLTTGVTESSSIKVNFIELPRIAVFKYLGLAVASDGKLMVGVNSRVSAAWSKWRSLTGVLCDKKIPERFKSKIYRAFIRPVAMYGAECWPATKEQKFGVAPIADKMREARLRWYGYVLLGKEDSVRKIRLMFEVVGKRPSGRPKQRWSDTLHMDLKGAGSTLI
ncbi:unnamed protein product [Heligmosomoides polygyrus]|uniref:Reverse transcriptase domain-containing protein n=1 Tax=Heligmosomoides polygyrus TaxID=6339 RepID=A0A183G5B0_HELPZ|nr:unnamed protein product [Heligmosomoides polygyrus]